MAAQVPAPSAWRYEFTNIKGRYFTYKYSTRKPSKTENPNCVPMFTLGQMMQYGQACVDELFKEKA